MSTESKNPPFRLHLTGGDALETEKAWEFLHASVHDRYNSRDKGGHLSDEDIEGWKHHPSEMVRWLVIRGQATSMRRDYVGNRPMVHQAITEAGAEGVTWTPLLDSMAAEDIWPSKDGFSDGFYEEEGSLIPSPEEWLRGSSLEDWVSQATDPSELDRLLTFKSAVVWETVARHAQALNEEQVQWLLEQGGGYTANALWDNSDVRGTMRDHVVEYFYSQYDRYEKGQWEGRCLAKVRRAARDDQLPQSVLHQVLGKISGFSSRFSWDGQRRRVADDQEILRVVLGSPSLDITSIETVADVGDAYARAVAVCHPNATPEFWDKMLAEPDATDWLREFNRPGWRGEYPGEALIDRLLEEEDLPIATATGVIFSKHITVEQLRRISNRWSDPEVRESLAVKEEARQDPEIRRAILSSRSPKVANQIIDHCTAEEFRPVFRLLARYDAEEAARMLKKVPEGAGMQPEDLQPLLESEDQQVRLAAIAFIGQTEEQSGQRVEERKTGGR